MLRLEADGRQMSPRAANIRALGTAFNNADLQTDEDEMTWALEEIDSEGGYNAMAYDNDGFDFTYQLRNGLKYNYGHGRNRCSYVKCTDPEKYAVQGFPANCAFNKAWWLPDQFKPCGDKRAHVSASDGTSQASQSTNLSTGEEGRGKRERRKD